MKKINELKKVRDALILVSENKSVIEAFVFTALSHMKLKEASEKTGLSVTKLSRAQSGKGLADDDLFKCFIELSDKL